MNEHYTLRELSALFDECARGPEPELPDELTAHLGECHVCQQRWAFVQGLARGMDTAGSGDAPEGMHLSPEVIDAILTGSLVGDAQTDAIDHLARCNRCLDEVMEAGADVLSLEDAAPHRGAPAFRPPGLLTPMQRLWQRLMGSGAPFAAGVAAAVAIMLLVLPGRESPDGLTPRDPSGSHGGAQRAGQACERDDDCASRVCAKTRIGTDLRSICRLAEGEPCDATRSPLGLCAPGLICAPDDDAHACRVGECLDSRECPADRPACIDHSCVAPPP